MPPVDERRWRPPQPWTPDTSDTPGIYRLHPMQIAINLDFDGNCYEYA
jgi:hypothetical protein